MNAQPPLFDSLNNGKYNNVSNITLDINLPSKVNTATIVHYSCTSFEIASLVIFCRSDLKMVSFSGLSIKFCIC